MNAIGKVWIAGATGLVGGETLGALLADQSVSEVLAVVRRTTGRTHAKLVEKRVDFEQLEEALHGLSANTAFCCLGSTIKQAGSQTQFRHIDHDYALAFARAARHANVTHMLVVTALGADPRSRVFYNRVKGELEQALDALAFPVLTIVRPSLLIGERSESRLGEKLAAPLLRMMPKSLRGIEGRTVGRALVRLAHEQASGRRVVLSKELHALGE
jgi:uncharacterized protein YbjT (DUF2867 family)